MAVTRSRGVVAGARELPFRIVTAGKAGEALLLVEKRIVGSRRRRTNVRGDHLGSGALRRTRILARATHVDAARLKIRQPVGKSGANPSAAAAGRLHRS